MSHPDPEVKCANCVFYDALTEKDGISIGLCKIKAPTQIEQGWPEVDFNDWCGEFAEPVKLVIEGQHATEDELVEYLQNDDEPPSRFTAEGDTNQEMCEHCQGTGEIKTGKMVMVCQKCNGEGTNVPEGGCIMHVPKNIQVKEKWVTVCAACGKALS